jgi:hypothetical protein
MNIINIDGSSDTPRIVMNPGNNHFEITGISLPENAHDFYQQVFNWLDDFTKNPTPNIIMDVKLKYFNTASSKAILEIFLKLEVIHKKGYDVLIRWHYQEDDEDMLDAGEQYAELVDIPFEHIEY